jgi:hypothetical protein
LATAFLLQAIDRGHRGYFVTFPELLHELFQSLADRSEPPDDQTESRDQAAATTRSRLERRDQGQALSSSNGTVASGSARTTLLEVLPRSGIT